MSLQTNKRVRIVEIMTITQPASPPPPIQQSQDGVTVGIPSINGATTTAVMIPSPTGGSLALVSALCNPEQHALHLAAIEARDKALSDPTTYAPLLVQLLYILIGCNQPEQMIQSMNPNELYVWQQSDQGVAMNRLQQNPSLWIPFGQTAGLILKNALIRPPVHPNNINQVITVPQTESKQIQETLLLALQQCNTYNHYELVSVVTSTISSVAVSEDGIQPYLHISNWSNLISTILYTIEQYQQYTIHSITSQQPEQSNLSITNSYNANGSIQLLQKMLEDGPGEIPEMDLDQIVTKLIRLLLPISSSLIGNNTDITTLTATAEHLYDHHLASIRIVALQCLATCMSRDDLFPSTFVAHWTEYIAGLSHLANISSNMDTNTTMNQPVDPNFQKHINSTITTTNVTIRKWVCRNIVTVLQTRTEYIIPYLQELCPFMLSATTSSPTTTNEASSVALEACDFWLTFATLDDSVVSGTIHDIVATYLPHLIPTLLQNMIYPYEKQQELEWLNSVQQQEETSVITNDIRPIFHKSRAATKHAGGNNATTNNNYGSNADDDDDDDDDFGDGDDDDEFDEDDDDGWTVRKCAAASLDALSNLYGGDIILPHLLPSLEIGLQASNEPWKQEACIMALGAIAEGCYEEMTDHMTQIYPYLMNILATESSVNGNNDQGNNTNGTVRPQLPQLKCMAAWTAGQYAVWVVEQVQANVQGHLLAELSELLLKNLSDNNTRVQIACGAAFGVLVGAAGDLLTPYLEPIMNALSATLMRYHGRSLLTIIDVFGTLGECVGPAIAEGTLPSLYAPALMQLWDNLIKTSGISASAHLRDRTVIPLMESLASIALSCGTNFQPYALDCFNNSMSIIEYVTLALAVSSDDAIVREEDVDPLVAAADLIDSMVEGLGSNFTALLNSSPRYGPQFLNMLVSLCKHEVSGVRMSALALVGDLTRNTPAVLQPALPQIIHELINCLDTHQPSVAINAAWALGEICLQCKGQSAIMEPYSAALLQNAIGLLMGSGVFDDGTTHYSTVPGLIENVAACVGRLALVNPMFVASDLPRFLCGWCDGLGKIRDPAERHDAFTGFVQAIYANPQAIGHASGNVIDSMVSILFAILTWHIPEDLPDDSFKKMLTDKYRFVSFPASETELGAALVKLVHDMKQSVGENEWNVVTKRLPVNVRKLFREVYNL